MYSNISSTIQTCVDKAENILKEGEPQIQMAEKILNTWAKPEAAKHKQVQDKAETKKDPEFWSTKRFHPQQNLRPVKLEKESTMEEVQHFCTCLEAFLMDGYAGNIPQEEIHFQLTPLMNSFWWKILLDRNMKSLDN